MYDFVLRYKIISIKKIIIMRKTFKNFEALEQAALRGCGCPVPAGARGQVGWGPGQIYLVGGNQPMAEGWNSVGFKVLSNPSYSVAL